jgi:hypothetical protein
LLISLKNYTNNIGFYIGGSIILISATQMLISLNGFFSLESL